MGVFTRTASASASASTLAPDYEVRTTGTYATPTTSLVASSQRIRIDDRKAMEKLRTHTYDIGWQHRAWAAYDQIGEIYYGFNLMADMIARVRFYPAVLVNPNAAPAPTDSVKDLTPGIADAAASAMRRLARGQSSPSSIARALALNFSIPGECYLVQIPKRTEMTSEGVITHPETWEVRSIDEVVVTSDPNAPIRIKTRQDAAIRDYLELPKTAFIGRIWRRHPRWSSQADSSLRPVLDLVDELLLLNQTFKATARSRLNTGILFVPDGLSASTPALPADPSAPLPADVDEFEQSLIDGMMTPISDPSDASAVVPILVRGPEHLGEKIKLIQFERTFDPSLIQRSDRVLERILQGIDLPKDIVSGMANVRYSNAIQIEETLFKAHVEPLTLLICDTLTDVYLRPALQAAGFTREQAERIRLWYDPSEVVTHPNRNQDAINAYDRYSLSSRALREAMGFNDTDAPSTTEILMRMLQQKGPMTPELAEALMRVLDPKIMESARASAAEASGNALPPELESAMFGGEPATPAPEPTPAPAPEPQQPPQPPPAPEPGPSVSAADDISIPAPAPPPKVQGPRAAAPAVSDAPEIPGLPPFPRT